MHWNRWHQGAPDRTRVGILWVAVASLAASTWWAGLLTASEAGSPSSADKNPRVWQPQIRSVAVFKNGMGFFMSDGEASLEQGWCQAEDVPPASFGTLAIYVEDEKQTVDIVGSGPGQIVAFDGHDAPADSATKLARLKAAEHLNLELHFTQDEQEHTATGKLVSVGPE